MAVRANRALYPAGIVLRVQGPGDARGQQGVHQDPQDRGRVHDLSFRRRFRGLVHELADWEDHYREHVGAGSGHYKFRRLYYRGAYGAERALHSHASRRAAVRAARRERDRGCVEFLGCGGRDHYLAVPGRPCPRGRVRRLELAPMPWRQAMSGRAEQEVWTRKLAIPPAALTTLAQPLAGGSACAAGRERPDGDNDESPNNTRPGPLAEAPDRQAHSSMLRANSTAVAARSRRTRRAPYAACAEVHAGRWRCIKIRPRRCLRRRGRDCLPCEELQITARRAADLYAATGRGRVCRRRTRMVDMGGARSGPAGQLPCLRAVALHYGIGELG